MVEGELKEQTLLRNFGKTVLHVNEETEFSARV